MVNVGDGLNERYPCRYFHNSLLFLAGIFFQQFLIHHIRYQSLDGTTQAGRSLIIVELV